MSDHEREDTRALWNRVADDWRMQVGDADLPPGCDTLASRE